MARAGATLAARDGARQVVGRWTAQTGVKGDEEGDLRPRSVPHRARDWRLGHGRRRTRARARARS